ncbi:MAG: hypothetical protein ACRED5_12125 [Propylenella sp.]
MDAKVEAGAPPAGGGEQARQEDEPEAVRSARVRVRERLRRLPKRAIGALLGLMAAIVVAAGNIESFAGLVGKLAPATSEAMMAVAMQSGWLRGYVGRGLLATLFPNAEICNFDSRKMDLGGDGLSADLVLFFSSGRAEGGCWVESEYEREAAFFQWRTTRFEFVGNPRHPDDLISWFFVGSVAFRSIASSDWPPIEAYMLLNGRLELVGVIDTFNDAEDSWLEERVIPGGAELYVPSGIWRVRRTSSERAVVEQLALNQIVLQDGHSRLIGYMEGALTLDGEPAGEPQGTDVDAPDSASDANAGAPEIFLKPLDRIYIVGCRPGQGVTRHPTVFAAFLVDFASDPELVCRKDEDDESPLHVKLKRLP